MKYQITSTGNVVIADQAFMDAVHANDYTLIPDDPVPIDPATRILTKLEYMDKFTDAELAGIYTAAKTVVQVEIWLEKFKLATDVNLDDPRTLTGLQAMEAGGLLADGRAAEIVA